MLVIQKNIHATFQIDGLFLDLLGNKTFPRIYKKKIVSFKIKDMVCVFAQEIFNVNRTRHRYLEIYTILKKIFVSYFFFVKKNKHQKLSRKYG